MKTIRSSYQHTDPINRKTCLFEAFSLENADKKRLRKNSETFRKKEKSLHIMDMYWYINRNPHKIRLQGFFLYNSLEHLKNTK